MSNKLSAVLILCMSTVYLSGCDLLRVTGPCYGVGCPAGTAGRSGQYKQGEGPKAQNAPAPANSASAPTQTAAAQTNTVQPNAPAQTASASTTPQPTAAQSSATPSATTQAAGAQATTAQPAPAPDASAEAKPSPLHSIGEFFARLIPHHNSGAKSGASD
jgi:hypothetical protein